MLSRMCCSGKRSPRLWWMQTEINFPQIDAEITALHHLWHIQNCAVIVTKICCKHGDDTWKLSEDTMRFQNSERKIRKGKWKLWMETFKKQKYEEMKVAKQIDIWSKTELNRRGTISQELWITNYVLGIQAKYKKAMVWDLLWTIWAMPQLYFRVI